MTAKLSVRRLRKNDWPVVAGLFGHSGACGGCWCRYWFLPRGGKLWDEMKGPRNRRAMQADLAAGKVRGSLAFRGKECVGWCCYGKTRDFPRLVNSKSLFRDPPHGCWSIVCFFIPVRQRGSAVASGLLEHAVKIISGMKSATCIESYPVSLHAYADGQAPAAFAWTGVPKLFTRAGFRVYKRKADTRPIYRLLLDR